MIADDSDAPNADLAWLENHKANASDIEEAIFLEDVLRLTTLGIDASIARLIAVKRIHPNAAAKQV